VLPHAIPTAIPNSHKSGQSQRSKTGLKNEVVMFSNKLKFRKFKKNHLFGESFLL
jgi:hypothetical protein